MACLEITQDFIPSLKQSIEEAGATHQEQQNKNNKKIKIKSKQEKMVKKGNSKILLIPSGSWEAKKCPTQLILQKST